MSEEQVTRANDLAMQIATTELLRLVLGELAFDDDPIKFKRKLSLLDERANNSLRSRQHFPTANEKTEEYIKEAACGYVTRLIGSIKHPEDQ